MPNDLDLRSDGVCAAVITGPNMGGKSCIIRQAALTVIMAQARWFVCTRVHLFMFFVALLLLLLYFVRANRLHT